jgi:putative spermidine/putrescine transport system ATP-binding protein
MQLEIKRLHTSLGVTILYVTHDQEEALVMSDRICLMNRGRVEQLGRPHELYFRPRTVFAADFLGDSNILDAVVQGDELRATGELVSPAPPGLASGTPTKIMIRPESLRVLDGGERAECTVDGTLEDVIFVGGLTKFRVRVAEQVVLVATRLTAVNDTASARGMPIKLGWSPSAIVVLAP